MSKTVTINEKAYERLYRMRFEMHKTNSELVEQALELLEQKVKGLKQ